MQFYFHVGFAVLDLVSAHCPMRFIHQRTVDNNVYKSPNCGVTIVMSASDIAAVGTTFNVFSYDAVWAEN